MTAFSRWWYQHVNGWTVVAAVGVFLVFGATVLPAQAEKTERYAGSQGTPDTSFIYTPDDLYDAAERFGEQGRSDFIYSKRTFDVVWPLVYAFFLCTLLTALLRLTFPGDSRWRLLNLLPWAAVVMDYLENTFTSLVMSRYPERTAIAADLAPVMTSVKWTFTIGSFVLLIGLAIDVAIKRLRRRAA